MEYYTSWGKQSVLTFYSAISVKCVHLYHVVDAEQSGEISTVVRSHVIYSFLFSGGRMGVRWC